MGIFEVISFIFITLFIVLIIALALFGIFYLVHFHWRSCRHCGHTMKYKGLKSDENNGHYLFHCPKCGAWEQIPKEEFLRQLDADKGIFGHDQQML